MDFFRRKNKQEIIPNSFQEWLLIDDIHSDTLFLKDKRKIAILKVQPINFKLKSKLEQTAILNQYKMFLKNLNSNIQIIVSSKKTDISYHLDEIKKNSSENSQTKEMSEDYIFLLKQIMQEKGAITKDFYIVLEEKDDSLNSINTIKEYLQNCGNEVERCSDDEIKEIFKNVVNKRLQSIV